MYLGGQTLTRGAETTPLYFLHIPKTAGTSFFEILHANFPSGEVCPAYLWRELLALPRKSLPSYRLFRGHFYAYLDVVVRQPLTTLTFLRDPIERSLSHYAHIRRWPGHYFHEHAQRQGSFAAFLQDPVTTPLIENFQSRALVQRLDPVSIQQTLTPAQVDAFRLEQALETAMLENVSQTELLVRAKARVDALLFVGITEAFSESVEWLSRRLGWPKPVMPSRLNVGGRRPDTGELDPKTLRLLRERTLVDQALYDYANQRLRSLLENPSVPETPLPGQL